MNMIPKILLSANTKKQYYIDAVNFCGGEAVAEYCPKFSNDYDGLILCGGNDIDPMLYCEDISGAVNIDYERDKAEIALAKAFIKENKPVMGICRGHQLLNVIFGGSLFQDIPNSHIHTSRSDYDLVHSVKALNDSVCTSLYGESFSVNSFHHQAIKVLADDLRATITSDDVIEGFEHKILPVIGFQFHPERMCFSQKRDDTVDGAKIFEYFVKLCRMG